MVFDATFWVAISFIIFFGVLIYLKVPLKINESLNKLIADIKNELNESEKLYIIYIYYIFSSVSICTDCSSQLSSTTI